MAHSLEPGGTERRLVAVLAGLDRSRFEPRLVCLDALGPLLEDVRAVGVEPVLLGRSRRVDPTGVLRLARHLRRVRADLVHGWLSLPSAYVRLAGPLAGTPVRVASEGGAVVEVDRSRVRRVAVLDRLLAPWTDAYLANSTAVADTLRARGVADEKIVVVHNGVTVPPRLSDPERADLRRELGADDGVALVGMVARLDPRFKDHGTFLEMVATLSRRRPLRAVVVGDGPGRQGAEQRARALGIGDRVRFTGYRADASRVLGALDVSVLLSYSEGFSNVVLESMAIGVPLVVTDIPPNREAVTDGHDALVVPVSDVAATGVAVERLLDNPALARRLGEAARTRARADFSNEAQAEATMALYERLLARNRR